MKTASTTTNVARRARFDFPTDCGTGATSPRIGLMVKPSVRPGVSSLRHSSGSAQTGAGRAGHRGGMDDDALRRLPARDRVAAAEHEALTRAICGVGLFVSLVLVALVTLTPEGTGWQW